VSPPVLSICIPSYNREAMALELLRELDTPGFLPFSFEVMLVDNASSASSYDSVRSFTPRHYTLRYLRLGQTIDAFANVMGTIRRAAGEFCVYLADDDRLVPDALADAVAVMQGRPDILASYALWDYYDLAEQKVIGYGALLDDAIFTDATAAQPLSSMVSKLVAPENCLFRTTAVAGSLLPSALHYWSFIAIARLLRHGAIRSCGRTFYRYVFSRQDEPYPRATLSSRLPFKDWAALCRGFDLWARYLPAEWLPKRPENSPVEVMRHSFLELAISSAIARNRPLEAFDIALTLKADAGYTLPMIADAISNLCLNAMIEALHEVLQSVPEAAGLCVQGFEDAFCASLQQNFAAFGHGRVAPVVPVVRVPTEALRHHVVLTPRETERPFFFEHGCAPGLVYSLERLLRVFSADLLPPPRNPTPAS
jgi:glycosyltransferase involved in cell wall biosynthesis